MQRVAYFQACVASVERVLSRGWDAFVLCSGMGELQFWARVQPENETPALTDVFVVPPQGPAVRGEELHEAVASFEQLRAWADEGITEQEASETDTVSTLPVAVQHATSAVGNPCENGTLASGSMDRRSGDSRMEAADSFETPPKHRKAVGEGHVHPYLAMECRRGSVEFEVSSSSMSNARGHGSSAAALSASDGASAGRPRVAPVAASDADWSRGLSAPPWESGLTGLGGSSSSSACPHRSLEPTPTVRAERAASPERTLWVTPEVASEMVAELAAAAMVPVPCSDDEDDW